VKATDELISFFISYCKSKMRNFVLLYACKQFISEREYSRREESAFVVEIRIRTDFTKRQPMLGPRMQVHKIEIPFAIQLI